MEAGNCSEVDRMEITVAMLKKLKKYDHKEVSGKIVVVMNEYFIWIE